MTAVRIALVGVGNCASSLVQGLAFHAIGDVRVVAAFDVAPGKVGRDVAEAIWAPPNNALAFADDMKPLGVTVQDGAAADVAEALCAAEAEVVVSLLPTGSQQESERYADAAVRAGCAFVNCLPATIARHPAWATRFAAAGVPLIGDDLRSGFGTTLVHRAVLDALRANGVEVVSTYQLNTGGNEDFRTLEDPAALAAKQATKTAGMTAAGAGDGGGGAAAPAYVGTTYIPHLADRKTAFIRVEAVGFGRTPIEIDVRMELEDSPSAAPVILEAVRAAARARAEGRGGVLAESARLMKAAPATNG